MLQKGQCWFLLAKTVNQNGNTIYNMKEWEKKLVKKKQIVKKKYIIWNNLSVNASGHTYFYDNCFHKWLLLAIGKKRVSQMHITRAKIVK